jgi:hypothetical protein
MSTEPSLSTLLKILNSKSAGAPNRNINVEAEPSPNQTSENPAPDQAATAKKPDSPQSSARRCRIHACRDVLSGQFYALTHEDRAAFTKHCEGIVADFQPADNRQRWLAAAVAQDQWRLNRARALENNIFALGMSGAIADATQADSPEVLAAACQARVWLADSKSLQMLIVRATLYGKWRPEQSDTGRLPISC